MSRPKSDLLPRRDVLRGTLCLGILSCSPALAHSPTVQSLFDRLSQRIAVHPLPCALSRVELLKLDSSTNSAQTSLRAVIRLTWPPGVRQHVISTQDFCEDGAVDKVSEQIGQLLKIVA